MGMMISAIASEPMGTSADSGIIVRKRRDVRFSQLQYWEGELSQLHLTQWELAQIPASCGVTYVFPSRNTGRESYRDCI